MFFEFMPSVNYQFGSKEIKEVENIVISVNPVDEIYSNRYFDNKMIGGETPEEIAVELYRDPGYYWNLLYINKIINPFTEWVKDASELEEYCLRKYGSNENLTSPKYFTDIATKQILVGVAEDAVYKYMEENDGELPLGVYKTTHYEYEQMLNDERRNIRYVPPQNLLSFNDTFETAMRANSGEIR